MNEPRRLNEESRSDLERALLSAGVSYRSSAEARAKTLAALGLAGSAAVSAGVASVGLSALFGKLGWGKVMAAVSIVGAISAVPIVYYGSARGPSPVAAARTFASTPVRAREPAVSPAPPGESQPAPALAPLVGPAPEATAATTSTARSTRPEATPPGSNAALAAELGDLDAVRSALANGDASGALTLLDTYTKKHPRGRLQLEAEVLRIDALSKSGQVAAAKQRAEAFLRQRPNSILASRVRRYLNE